MNEACDRCGPAVRAAYRLHKQGELYLCRHCASRLWPAMSVQGWTIWPVSGHAPAPQADEYVTDLPVARGPPDTGQRDR
jgi:hypothetical protein